ncbi:MAG: T9SS type A sorting domain-containing protein, partial [Chloroherpetonaceae bacterium]
LAVNSDLSLEIYNINGVKVKQKNYSSMKYGSYDVYINISDLTDGVYFIKISNLDMLNTEKFILIK